MNNTYFKSLFLLLGLLFVIGCQEDNLNENLADETTQQQKLFITYKNMAESLQDDKALDKAIQKVQFNSKDQSSSLYNFSFDETKVQVMQDSAYTQYTFLIKRDDPTYDVVENYICRVFNNDSVDQYITSYPIIETQDSIYVDYTSSSITPIDDYTIVIGKGNLTGCVPEYEQGEVCELISRCTHPVGNHASPSNCSCTVGPGCDPPVWDCRDETYVSLDCGGIGSGDSPSNPIGNTGGTYTGGTDDSSDEDNINEQLIAIPIQPKIILSPVVRSFVSTLPQDHQDWLNSLTDCTDSSSDTNSNCNQELYDDIAGFLNANTENGQVTAEAENIILFILDKINLFLQDNNQNLIDSETLWDFDLSTIEEPKWGQLANVQEILDEINSIPNLNNLTFDMQINSLINHFEKNLMYGRDEQTGELFIENSQNRVRRYIYSQNGGWIDFHHVFKLFKWAKNNGSINGILGGDMGELMQSAKQNASAFSYEDLPSNLFGVAMFVRFGFDLENGNITWHDAIQVALNEINCLEPEQAPNFQYIPHIVTNGAYPQNFTYSPLLGDQLEEIHRDYFCKRPIKEQINIKEAHENFPR